MNFEPEKFFIGIVDFFSILMPGALLAYFGKDWAARLLGQPNFRLDGSETWMIFLFASYLLGHFVFLFGALLDDMLYNPFRSCTYWGQIGRLAKGKKLSGRIWRALAKSDWFFGKSADKAVMQAERMKARALQGLSAEDAINAYQWSKARLSTKHTQGLVAVQRFEADSKFFRSFIVVLTVLAVIYAFQRQWIPVLMCAGFLLPALWRYINQRFKSTQQAYWHILTLEGMKELPAPPTSQSHRSDGLTHAGGLVYCKHGNAFRYLLVEATKDRTQWVLPKGHIEPGENPRETAVREVKEETGYWARIVKFLQNVTLDSGSPSTVSRFYLMEHVKDKTITENEGELWLAENRQHQWLTLDEANQSNLFLETTDLMEQAEKFLLAPKEQQSDEPR